MVSFVCDICQETVKKPKLDAHFGKCKRATFSCVDCSTSFKGSEYKSHTSCISEVEKYQKSLYKGKSENKSTSTPVSTKKTSKTPLAEEKQTSTPSVISHKRKHEDVLNSPNATPRDEKKVKLSSDHLPVVGSASSSLPTVLSKSSDSLGTPLSKVGMGQPVKIREAPPLASKETPKSVPNEFKGTPKMIPKEVQKDTPKKTLIEVNGLADNPKSSEKKQPQTPSDKNSSSEISKKLITDNLSNKTPVTSMKKVIVSDQVKHEKEPSETPIKKQKSASSGTTPQEKPTFGKQKSTEERDILPSTPSSKPLDKVSEPTSTMTTPLKLSKSSLKNEIKVPLTEDKENIHESTKENKKSNLSAELPILTKKAPLIPLKDIQVNKKQQRQTNQLKEKSFSVKNAFDELEEMKNDYVSLRKIMGSLKNKYCKNKNKKDMSIRFSAMTKRIQRAILLHQDKEGHFHVKINMGYSDKNTV